MKTRILSFILTVLMLLGTAVTVSAYNGDYLMRFTPDNTFDLGDANDDTAVNAVDVLVMRKNIAGYDAEYNPSATDFDADGKLTSKDVFCLKSCLSGAKTVSDYEDKSHPTYKLTIGGYLISEFDIVVPADCDPKNDNTFFAAEYIQTALAKVTGFEPAIVYGVAASAKEHHIIFHAIDPFGEEAQNGFGMERYDYDVTDGNLNVYGSLRGNMYAVFEICEEYLGVRFIHDSQTFAYKQRRVDIPEGTNVSFTPRLEFRFCGQVGYSGSGSYMINYIPRRMNGTQCYCGNVLKYGYLTGPQYANAHSFAAYYAMYQGDWPEDDFVGDRRNAKLQDGYKKFPDLHYGWQPCANSDEVYEQMFEGMLLCHEMAQSWGNPVEKCFPYGIETVSFSINDNSKYCTCSICVAMANGGFKNFGSKQLAEEFLATYEGDAEYAEKTGKRPQYGVQFAKESYSGVYLNMTNRFARDVQEYYPGARVLTIIYDHTIPASIRPESNIVMMFCGHGCNNHIFGSGDCGTNTTCLGTNNTEDEVAARAWSDMCHANGAKIWFWSYDVNYSYYTVDTPCLFNIYYDFRYLIDVCGFDGYFYEGQSAAYVSTELVKAYIAQQLAWNPTMTYDEFIDMLKETLYYYYGKGYEQIYQLLVMLNEAGDEMPCFINNHDRPGDMFSYSYIEEHYEEMRALIDEAYALADTDFRKNHIDGLYMTVDFLGLSSSHTDMYLNGTDESRALYMERYDRLYNYLSDNDIPVFDPSVETYFLPDEIDYEVNPMIQFYGVGSNIPGLYP